MIMDVAIELGTSYTSLYLSGAGLVLREPSVVAFVGDKDAAKLLAVGEDAVAMQGRTPDKTTVVCPISDGYIVDSEACVKMLTQFIKRILPSYVIFPKIRALLAVPTGLTVGERKVYEDVVRSAGAAEVAMVDNSICTALGFDLPVSSPVGGLVVNTGGGVTEIALVSMLGTISGCSVNVGGNMMDKALVDFVLGRYKLRIGVPTARKVKESIGSLYPNDTSFVTIKGVGTLDSSPASMVLYASDVYEALYPYYSRIGEAVKSIVNVCPPELAQGLHDMGVYVAGGAAKIPGADRVIGEQLDLAVNIAEDPEYVAITGAGRLLGDKDMLRRINDQQ